LISNLPFVESSTTHWNCQAIGGIHVWLLEHILYNDIEDDGKVCLDDNH